MTFDLKKKTPKAIFFVLIMSSIYYVWPLKNVNNVAPENMITNLTSSAEYNGWLEIHTSLNEGYCLNALYSTFFNSSRKASHYWLSRMFEVGACAPQIETVALAFANSGSKSPRYEEAIRLAYFAEKGIGLEKDEALAQEIYLEIMQEHFIMDSLYKWIISEQNFIFSGEYGTPLFEKAFQEYQKQNEPQ